jgi:hypothetical protein
MLSLLKDLLRLPRYLYYKYFVAPATLRPLMRWRLTHHERREVMRNGWRTPGVITGLDPAFCEYLVRLGIAREIHPSCQITNDELDREVDTEGLHANPTQRTLRPNCGGPDEAA